MGRQWIDARALRGGLALTTDWQLIGGRLVLDWQHTVFRSEPGLVPDWYWYCAGLTSMHHGLARFRQSKMGSRLASDSSRIGALALHWRLDTGSAVIANLRQSSPICQSGSNPPIPPQYKITPIDMDWVDWRRIKWSTLPTGEENEKLKNSILEQTKMDSAILKKNIETLIETKIDELTTSMKSLENDIKDVGATASQAFDTGTKNELAIAQLNTKIIDLENVNKELSFQVEDGINRNMRANLVFKNISEEVGEDVTAKITAKIINYTGWDTSFIEKSIVRAHRNGPPSNKRRSIVVKFAREDIADTIYQHFIKGLQNSIEPNDHIQCNKQYSKATQDRINLAMIDRRKLLRSKDIIKGHVKYPAKLFVMYTGTTKYVMYDEY